MSIATYTKTCSTHTPGNNQLILIACDDVASITAVDNEVTEMVQDAGDDAIIVPIDRDGMVRMDEQTATKGGLLYVNQKLEIELSKSSKELEDFITGIADTSPCGILAIVTDNNGARWLMGAQLVSATSVTFTKGLFMESANFNSGKALDEEDGDKYILTLSGMFPNGAIHIEETKVIDVTETTLIAAAA
jgi:hypothetical protein